MSVETLKLLSLIFCLLAGLLAVTALILFFALKIHRTFLNMTGISARKAISRIRRENLERETSGAITDSPVKTEKISTFDLSKGAKTTVLPGNSGNETVVLGGSETVVLGGSGTAAPGGNASSAAGVGETVVLEPSGIVLSGLHTTDLSGKNLKEPTAVPTYGMNSNMSNPAAFTVEEALEYTDSKEIIE